MTKTNKTLKRSIILFSIFYLQWAMAFAQTYEWAKGMGDTLSDYGNSIAVDGSGNIYITGNFQGTTDFDPGTGTANLTSAGLWDIFFAKYDSGGNYVWAKGIGGLGWDNGLGLALDDTGNVYITGYFQDTADFDPGAGTVYLTSAGGEDIILAKYDTDGNYVWAKGIGSTNDDFGYGIALDVSGNVYITGYFQDTTDFD
ncbi:SBBP repeat-containing protein, partial [Candidatus Amoebophilus asiaticus]|nr:SBBP repeat-containing protein [Candidatus Amoebophilus asiaticus]